MKMPDTISQDYILRHVHQFIYEDIIDKINYQIYEKMKEDDFLSSLTVMKCNNSEKKRHIIKRMNELENN